MREAPLHGHIDISFDVMSDTRPGGDPDRDSPTLRRYHQRLWSRPLPVGVRFDLDMTTRGAYLHQARGRHRLICDRFDPTLECIRRQYAGEDNPLAACLARFDNFFALFGDFEGYVRFWLLDDLTQDGYPAVKAYLPVEDFGRSPLPASPAEYETYAAAVLEFVARRNRRIAELVRAE